ncbi:uncharacterized protein [Clinocottus analis]|uniref:uncharacterized protein n=1 Tax=Clinocottus analis TaxID=304258 RepID=UPI0035C0EB00
MGCSPSKGKLFSKPGVLGPQQPLLTEAPQDGPEKALLAEVPEDIVDSRPKEEEDECFETDEKENELPLLTEEHSTKEAASSQLVSDSTGGPNAEDIKEAEVNVMPQKTISEVLKTDAIKKLEKRKRNKAKRKQRMSSIVQTKVDFPPHMVRAHEAAYAFMNPNISKYEALLDLLDQAAQTQLSLQPTMSAFVLRFEEINQALEEMAEEGEFMMKEHGDYMALPSGMMGPAVIPAKPQTDSANAPHPPPDLIQQLLQHSTEKMRLVAGSVRALGDTTIEEAAEYFSSLSKLMVEKLRAKQAAERRLTLVLARVEKAATRKFHPEDSSLHSEDSGIGGENESLAGSERHRRHRGSAGSQSCGSGSNIRCAVDPLPGNLLSLVGYNEFDEEDWEDDDDDDDEEYEDDDGDRPERKRSNSSPPDLRQPFIFMCTNYMQDQKSAFKRPLSAVTATKHTSSTRRPRKSRIIQSSDTVNDNEGVLVINGNNNNNGWPESRDDLDVDSLPPPPPEVLMDNSFQRTEVIPGSKERSQEESVLTLPRINQKARVSQRLKASVQNVDVLPNRGSVKPRSEQERETDLDPDIEKADCLYQRARKMIQLRKAGECLDKRDLSEFRGRGPSPVQARPTSVQTSNRLQALVSPEFSKDGDP